MVFSFVGKKKVSTKLLVSIVAALLVFLAAIFSLCICLLKKKSKKIYTVPKAETGIGDQDFTVESLHYDLSTLLTATNNFSDENKLGEGGFGTVYKGKLPNGRLIAVKRLSASSSQGIQEFETEILVVAKLQHRNLVRLLGFCYVEQEKLLVYEYVANKSLDNFLFDHENRQQLDWQRRYNIIKGIARGLLYLHHDSQLRIIHRDLKASNVLLDEEMNPKISDFGTSRIFGVDHSQSNYTNRVVGTYGYMAPEYALLGQFSIKSDAYSFGVLVLEIVSGEKNSTTFNHPNGVEDLLSHLAKQVAYAGCVALQSINEKEQLEKETAQLKKRESELESLLKKKENSLFLAEDQFRTVSAENDALQQQLIATHEKRLEALERAHKLEREVEELKRDEDFSMFMGRVSMLKEIVEDKAVYAVADQVNILRRDFPHRAEEIDEVFGPAAINDQAVTRESQTVGQLSAGLVTEERPVAAEQEAHSEPDPAN